MEELQPLHKAVEEQCATLTAEKHTLEQSIETAEERLRECEGLRAAEVATHEQSRADLEAQLHRCKSDAEEQAKRRR